MCKCWMYDRAGGRLYDRVRRWISGVVQVCRIGTARHANRVCTRLKCDVFAFVCAEI